MAGALNQAVDDDDQGAVDDAAYGVSPLANAADVNASQPNTYARGLYDTGQRILGADGDKNGALSRFMDVPAARAKAADQQLAGIRRAMNILQAAGTDRYNLPALAAQAAFGQPTGSNNPGGAFANANAAYTGAIERQRAQEMELANKMAGYEIDIGKVPGALTNEQAADYQRQVTAGREFESSAATAQERMDAAELAYRRGIGVADIGASGRERVADTAATSRERVAATGAEARKTAAQIAADARRDTAEAAAGARVSAAQIAADKDRYEYIGPLAGNANIGLYHDKQTNEPSYGPASPGKTAANGGQAMQIIEKLREENPDLTYADALALSKRAPNASAEQLRKEGMALTAAKGDVNYFSDPEGTWKSWRQRFGLPLTPFETPPKAAPPVAPAARPAPPAPSASPAPAVPAPRPAVAAPVPAAVAPPPTAGGIPQRPASLPAGSAYNPARKQWRDPAGRIYDLQGRPVGG